MAILEDPLVDRISGICIAEAPKGDLYSFNGTFKMAETVFGLTSEQLLLKGTVLKNTKWVVTA